MVDLGRRVPRVEPRPHGFRVVERSSSSAASSEAVVDLHAAERLSERLPVLDRHQVVEDGVNGGGDVVQDARDVHEILVNGAEDHRLLEVDVSESLGVERSPAEEEGDHDDG